MTKRSRGNRGSMFRAVSVALLFGLAVSLLGGSIAAQPSGATFVKITLGIGDATGRDWSGRVRVDGGTLVDLEP
ncbi:MAG: hypothetical protein ABIP48_09635 [Planctomycetota bacterium]